MLNFYEPALYTDQRLCSTIKILKSDLDFSWLVTSYCELITPRLIFVVLNMSQPTRSNRLQVGIHRLLISRKNSKLLNSQLGHCVNLKINYMHETIVCLILPFKFSYKHNRREGTPLSQVDDFILYSTSFSVLPPSNLYVESGHVESTLFPFSLY